jgi:hypothetical protein
VGGGFRKPRPANKPVALHSRWGASGFFPQTLGFFQKAVVEGIETLPFQHGVAPPCLLEDGGSATGVLITDKSHVPGGDGTIMLAGSEAR